MSPDLVRFIDKYFGIPLCFVFSIINMPFKQLAAKRKKPPKKAIFIELSEMGSTIIAYSGIMKFKKKFPDCETYFLIFNKNKESVELLNIFPNTHILTISDKGLVPFLRDCLKFFSFCLTNRISVVFDLELFSRATALISLFSLAKHKVGFHKCTAEGLYRGHFFTHNVFYNTHVHMVHNFHSLFDCYINDLNYLNKKNTEENEIEIPNFPFKQEVLAKFKQQIDTQNKTLIINPNAGMLLPIRNWETEKFAKVADYMATKYNMKIVIVGLPIAKKDAEQIRSKMNNKELFIDLTGKTKNINELVHVLQCGDILLTNDSGPAHFAALTDTNIITIFGPETHELYGPLSTKSYPLFAKFACSPCLSARNHRKTKCTDNKCIQAISAEDVIKVIEEKILPNLG